VSASEISARTKDATTSGETATFRAAFRRFRAFDRPNVLHLFTTFRRDTAFAREFPDAVQTGPLWPERYTRKRRRREGGGTAEWVWYASPASAERLAPAVLAGLATVHPPPHLFVVTPRPWKRESLHGRVTVTSESVPTARWKDQFVRAELRIVTGSRTLLEAMELGGPFLYFNGILGRGARVRRHRPEKLTALLDLARKAGVGASLRRDLADFARGRRVREVVARAATGSGGWNEFPSRWDAGSFRPPFDNAGSLIVDLARALARPDAGASSLVRRVRSGGAP
jgi:hypothetical protein